MNARHLPTHRFRSLTCPGKLRTARHLLLLGWLFCLAAGSFLRAQDSANDNPTGPTGDYNGEVTTAGSYDPFTMNAKRAVTDLVVPGAAGTYPLAFSRTYNSGVSVVANDTQAFGDARKWRHSYMWTLMAETVPPNNYVYAFDVAYPDGRTVTFSKNRLTAPASDPYWRGPTGVQDRLEVDSNNPSVAGAILHLSDGGLVRFGDNRHPLAIVDPYGATTTLKYLYPGNNAYLTDIVEPGGRSLHLDYATAQANNGRGTQWTVLTQVTASTGQSVAYLYGQFGTKAYENPDGSNNKDFNTPYAVLLGAVYNDEASVSSQGGNVQASYNYLQSSDGYFPVLQSASDPHYAGAMTSIAYTYQDATFGHIREEQNVNGQCVSHLGDYSDGGGTSGGSVTETRGDKAAGGAAVTRTFRYHEGSAYITSPQNDQSNAKNAQLTSVSDFEGNLTHLYYYGHDDKDTAGEGNLRSVVDPLGHTTNYLHEPITGRVNILTLPDGRQRQWLYWSKNQGDSNGALQPYYLLQTQDERGQFTTYYGYDGAGNRTAFTYHNQGQQTSPVGSDNGFNHRTYDANFNTRTTNSSSEPLNPSAGWTYVYDQENHLTGASGPGGQNATFLL